MSQVNFQFGRGKNKLHVKISNHGYYQILDVICMKKHKTEDGWYGQEVEEKCLLTEGTFPEGEVDYLSMKRLEVKARELYYKYLAKKRKELPEWVRKIASEMYPQYNKDSYSKWEVERLLIAVLDEADLLKEKVNT